MSAFAWLAAAAALVVAPVPASTPGDGENEAYALYLRKDYLEAADAAILSYVTPFNPAATRLSSARLAQEALSKAYQSTPRPEYLCRALDVLAATRLLAVKDEDVRRHEILSATHRATLTAQHPGHVCETGTELRPVLGSGPTRTPSRPVLDSGATKPPSGMPMGPPVADAPGSKSTDILRERRAPFALKTAGAVTTSFGVAALAAMVGGLAVRSRIIRAGTPLIDVKNQQGQFSVEQEHQLAALTNAGNAARQVAVAGGISGAVLLVLGAALIGRGHVMTARTRVFPVAAPSHAAFLVEGRF